MTQPRPEPTGRTGVRLRWTLAAVCVVLAALGVNDLLVWGGVRAPSAVTFAELLTERPPPANWLRVEGATLDLVEAISTSGTVELEALLFPLADAEGRVRVLVESRDPQALELFGRYHLGLDSQEEKARFLAEHAQRMRAVRPVTGLVLSGLTARANRDTLRALARDAGFQVAPDALFLTEGKEPAPVRGGAFVALGLLGLGRLLYDWVRRKRVQVG